LLIADVAGKREQRLALQRVWWLLGVDQRSQRRVTGLAEPLQVGVQVKTLSFAQVLSQRAGIGVQQPELLLARPALGLLVRQPAVVRGAGGVQAVSQREPAAGERKVIPARLAQRPLGCARHRARAGREPGDVFRPAATAIIACRLPEQSGERLQKADRAGLARRQEQQAGAELVTLAPDRVRRVGGVGVRLELEPRRAHRPQVELHERKQAPLVAIAQLDQRVRGERARLPSALNGSRGSRSN
jgi:hypothetical protein